MFKDGHVFTKTGVAHKTERLNYRYEIMFENIKHKIKGARILELGSHNGRWTYVLLKLGAEHVTGIEKSSTYIKQATNNLLKEGFPKSKFSFIKQDVEKFNYSGNFEVILCMGVLYYLNDPLSLLRKFKSLNPNILIIDTFHSNLIMPLSKVPPLKEFHDFLIELFEVKQLAVYDKDNRVAFHCFQKTRLL